MILLLDLQYDKTPQLSVLVFLFTQKSSPASSVCLVESQVVGLKRLEPYNEFVSVALEKPEVCRNVLCF